jgi:hypothetical protein
MGFDPGAQPDRGFPRDPARGAEHAGEEMGADHQHGVGPQPRRQPQQIGLNCISPGYVWTSLVENQIPDTMRTRGLTRDQVINDVMLAAQPTKQFVTPEQVAALALFLCRDEASAITGANLSMDGGWTAA